MLNNLLGVLLRFREEPVAMIGDIAKMFHSIHIPVLDQMTHRFLWRDLDERREPDTYVMTAVNMGDRPSGTMAIATLRKMAEMSKDEFPRSSETILNNSYMDDIHELVTVKESLRYSRGSSSELLLRMPSHITKKTLGDRAFQVSAPCFTSWRAATQE